jgi:hypothetical protein
LNRYLGTQYRPTNNNNNNNNNKIKIKTKYGEDITKPIAAKLLNNGDIPIRTV